MKNLFGRFLPDTVPVSLKERLRAAFGALLGILVTGLLGSLAVGTGPALPALIAPMGASAVLLFAVPASPLAQPWSILGGNVVAAFIGVTAALLVPDKIFAASALAVGGAIALMMTLRCIHPPSGAVALTAVLGGPDIHALGYGFVLWPVLGNSLALLAMAMIYNNITGRSYPHRAKQAPVDHGTKDPAPIQRIGFSSRDLDEVLADYDELLDIDRDDLEAILRRAELRSYRRRAGNLNCETIMSRDIITVSPQTSLQDAGRLMRAHHIKALPVTDTGSNVIGIVTQTDLLDKIIWSVAGTKPGIAARLRLVFSGAAIMPDTTVSSIMTAPVKTVRPDEPLAEAIIMFAEEQLHYLPVVTADNRLAGMLSQSDVLVAMLEDADMRTMEGSAT